MPAFYRDGLRFLSGDPVHMPGQCLTGLQPVQGIQFLGQLHFIKQLMNAVMTLAADMNTATQGFPGKIFPEIRPPVHFSWYQVMKGQCQFPITKAADIRALMPGIC